MLALSRIYGLVALINYQRWDESYIGNMFISSGFIIDHFFLYDISESYEKDSQAFLEDHAETILTWAIKYYRDENELINKDLWYMSDEDKEYLLEQFRQKKAVSINN